MSKLKNKVRLANKTARSRGTTPKTVVPFKVQQDINELKNTVGALTFQLEGERRRVASMKQVLKRHENNKMSAVEAVEMLVVETERIQREMKLVQDKNIVLTNTINEMNRNQHEQEEIEEREEEQEGKEGKRNNRASNKKTGKEKGKGNKNRHRNNNNEDNDDGKGSPTYSRSKVEELQRSVAMLEARNVMLERAVKRGGVGSRTSSPSSISSAAPTTSSPSSPSLSVRTNTSNRQNMMVKDQIDRAFKRLTSTTPGSTTSNSSSLSSLSSSNNQEEHDEATLERKEGETSGTSGSIGNNDEEGELSTAAMLKRLKAKREGSMRFLAQRHKPGK